MKKIGVIGGLGPESTCEFYRLLTRSYYERRGNHAYPEIIIYSVSFERFIERGYDSADDIAAIVERLHRAGADFAVAPCNSIHLVHGDVSQRIPIPWFSIMDATAVSIRSRCLDRVGLLGTRFTMSGDFYRDTLLDHGIETVVPDGGVQERINDIIFNELVRNIVTEDSRRHVLSCIERLREEGAQGIVLGCTELPFLIRQKDLSLPVFDTTAIYAEKTLDIALGDDDRS